MFFIRNVVFSFISTEMWVLHRKRMDQIECCDRDGHHSSYGSPFTHTEGQVLKNQPFSAKLDVGDGQVKSLCD